MMARKISVACCQFAPVLGSPAKSIEKVNKLIANLASGDVDILVLPEMAFTGYCFKTRETVLPLLEDKETGLTVAWARETARRLNCFVFAGYPRFDQDTGKSYNSACFVDRTGALLLTYDKHFLFEADEVWAEEGAGFQALEVPGIGKVGFGICMDINPRQFKAPWDAFEFANYHLGQGTQLLILSCAWLDSDPSSPNVHSVPNYWASRLKPLIDSRCMVVVCNRVGQEFEAVFTGCSCIISLREPSLLGILNKKQENVLVTQISLSE